jgi:hypothetical protein
MSDVVGGIDVESVDCASSPRAFSGVTELSLVFFLDSGPLSVKYLPVLCGIASSVFCKLMILASVDGLTGTVVDDRARGGGRRGFAETELLRRSPAPSDREASAPTVVAPIGTL